MSAHPIPGNEEMVHRIINRLFQRGANVLYDPIAPVHVSGHASQEEQKLLINLVRPRFFIPIHGELRHLKQHALMAQELGIPPDRIAVVENGTVIELDEEAMTVGERVPGGYVFVDGSGVGDIGPAVIRDREMLAEEGFVIVVVPVDARTRRPLAEPEILSRGFVYLREAGGLLENARTQVMKLLRQNGNRSRDELQTAIQNTLSKFFYNETRRRPMTFAVVVEVEPLRKHQERG
ncbi:MAG: ribonuclease J [Chloroflexi bacterium]|nr:MAG: ribonuclease J [Chloroflexota bacterium]